MTDVIPADQQFYSTKKVADLFDVTVETVRNWIDSGQLEAVKINGYWKVKRQSVIDFANSKYGEK